MANDINRVFLIGRLTKDPELRYTQGGTSIASFSIANNRSYTVQNEKKKDVSFFNCVAWGKGGEVLAQYAKKGSKIGIEGRLQQRSWDKDGQKRSIVEIVVENFQLLGGNGQHGGEQNGKSATSEPAHEQSFPADPDSAPSHFSDESIPF